MVTFSCGNLVETLPDARPNTDSGDATAHDDADADDATNGGGPVDGSAPTANLIFVTSSTHSADLGGLDGADNICAARAREAGLGGTYVAWLSTDDVDAKDRLSSARGWVRPDGAPFADTSDELISGVIFVPPRLDELGADIGAERVWTATSPDGELAAEGGNCDGWNRADAALEAGRGVTDGGTGSWTAAGTDTPEVEPALSTCDTPQRIYCLGIDHEVPVAPEPAAARFAFVSEQRMSSTAGIEEFDGQCQTEADEAGINGRFMAAVVAAEGTKIADRFNLDGPTWARPDGTPILDEAADLAVGPLSAPISQHPDGSYADVQVWSGAVDLGEVSSDNCDDWSRASVTGGVLRSGRTLGGHLLDCAEASGDFFTPFSFSLLCLQE